MAFPKKFAEFAARTRVGAGFAVAALVLWLAQPTPTSCVAGAGIAALGLALRAWAAGHLRKNEALTVSGPYAYVRNPLYLGSLIAGAGLTVAGANWRIGVVVVGYFVLYFLPVVEEEEKHLRKILPGYEEYCRRTPRLIPALRGRRGDAAAFSWALYRHNREHQAAIAYLAALIALALKALL